ncbi:MAG: DNA repair protein RecO C-terminal domain-containing protein, partial [Firmicutes bacterium]|nr:DNA repair protein RecO C-terminal domain-containing protein [Bacillota bacterium]
FELRFLDQLGLLPDLSACAACGQSPASSDPRRFLLSPQRGQLLCASCAEVAEATSGVSAGSAQLGREANVAGPAPGNSPLNPLPLLSPGALRYMTGLLTSPLSRVSRLRLSPALDREIEQALDPYLAYHLDYAGRAKAVLKQLL